MSHQLEHVHQTLAWPAGPWGWAGAWPSGRGSASTMFPWPGWRKCQLGADVRNVSGEKDIV